MTLPQVIEALKDALRPFAKAANDPFFKDCGNSDSFKTSALCVGDLRRAAEALASLEAASPAQEVTQIIKEFGERDIEGRSADYVEGYRHCAFDIELALRTSRKDKPDDIS